MHALITATGFLMISVLGAEAEDSVFTPRVLSADEVRQHIVDQVIDDGNGMLWKYTKDGRCVYPRYDALDDTFVTDRLCKFTVSAEGVLCAEFDDGGKTNCKRITNDRIRKDMYFREDAQTGFREGWFNRIGERPGSEAAKTTNTVVPPYSLTERMKLWRKQVKYCDADGDIVMPTVSTFPTKEYSETDKRSSNPEPCNDGDMLLFNGLLCASG